MRDRLTDRRARIDTYPSPPSNDYPPIASLSAIGDGHSLALLGAQGGVEWYCPSRFDNDALVWPLLDRARGGRLQIAPTDAETTTCTYRSETAVLEYKWQTPHARLIAHVWMAWPRQQAAQEIWWLVRAEGAATLAVHLDPRPGFGEETITLATTAQEITASQGELHLSFGCSAPLDWSRAEHAALLPIGDGQQVAFRLRIGDAAAEPVSAQRAALELERTTNAWREWAAGIEWSGTYRGDVVRSAITLKLLIYEPSGAVVAAATTSLPEDIGGVRNWDYRFTWLRDASFTLNALYQLGCRSEARRYAAWMCRTTAAHGLPLRVLYGVNGETEFPERSLDVEGYRASRPVRIGNAAEHQLQLDTYGELLDCITICELLGDDVMRAEWPHFERLADFAADHWREPDSGIWEVRDFTRHFVYSKAMAWVALDRASRLAETLRLSGKVDWWKREAELIRQDVLRNGVDLHARRYTRSFGEATLDSTLLLLPVIGFADVDDEIMQRTIDAVLRDLAPSESVVPGLLYRYPHMAGDGLPGREGTFTICSFWAVEALVLAGRTDEAAQIFESVCSLRGATGLFAEEIDPRTGEQLGNFPQAFTHIGLINAALRLTGRSAKGVMPKHAEEQR